MNGLYNYIIIYVFDAFQPTLGEEGTINTRFLREFGILYESIHNQCLVQSGRFLSQSGKCSQNAAKMI